MRRDDVGDAGGGEQPGRGGDGQVAAGVQVADIDAGERGAERAHEADRREQLPSEGDAVRQIAEHADVDPSRPFGRRVRQAHARDRIAGVGRADRDVVAAPRQPVGECRRDAWDPAVGPRVFEVRHDVQDAERGHGEMVPYIIRVPE